MSLLNNWRFRILLALIVGFLFAGAATKIPYPCPPADTAGCVSFEKAIMHPSDLLANKQDSLVTFTIYFVLTSLVTFMAISIVYGLKKNPRKTLSIISDLFWLQR